MQASIARENYMIFGQVNNFALGLQKIELEPDESAASYLCESHVAEYSDDEKSDSDSDNDKEK